MVAKKVAKKAIKKTGKKAAKKVLKRGSKSETVRKLTKTGDYTYYVTIPKVFIDELNWKERQRLVVKKRGNGLIVEDWKPKSSRK